MQIAVDSSDANKININLAIPAFKHRRSVNGIIMPIAATFINGKRTFSVYALYENCGTIFLRMRIATNCLMQSNKMMMINATAGILNK